MASYEYRQPRSRGSGLSGRLVIAIILVVVSLISYFTATEKNPITGQAQRVAMDPQQEIAMGLQAKPEMIRQHGGEIRDPRFRAAVDQVGNRLVRSLDQFIQQSGGTNPYDFEFHLLADDRTVNAFALPGGQVFITAALFSQLQTEGQLAGVLGHEIGHVVMRHGAQRLAKQKLTMGLTGAAGVAGGTMETARLAQAVGQMINMKYGRDDELESDKWGVLLCIMAGYDPRAMLGVMDVLDKASGGAGPPEMMSTHPKPANRKAYIQEVIDTVVRRDFPNGLPAELEP